MKKQRGYTLIDILVMFFVVAWIWNLVKLTSCDFESPYKCEVLHGIGVVIAPLSIGTVWVDGDQ